MGGQCGTDLAGDCSWSCSALPLGLIPFSVAWAGVPSSELKCRMGSDPNFQWALSLTHVLVEVQGFGQGRKEDMVGAGG